MSESDTFLLGLVLYMNLGALFISVVFAFNEYLKTPINQKG